MNELRMTMYDFEEVLAAVIRDGNNLEYASEELQNDKNGSIYVVDGSIIHRISHDLDVTTIAGSSIEGFNDGPGETAIFNDFSGIVVIPFGNIIIADWRHIRCH